MTKSLKISTSTKLGIGQDQINLLEKLCNAVSVSGDEHEVRQIVLEAVK